jgi:hypothetical protein
VRRTHGLHWQANYKTSKMVNELVINGYVYAEMEMEVEVNHMLSAVVNGHLIQAGTKHVGIYSYINVDGNQIARKIRWV